MHERVAGRVRGDRDADVRDRPGHVREVEALGATLGHRRAGVRRPGPERRGREPVDARVRFPRPRRPRLLAPERSRAHQREPRTRDEEQVRDAANDRAAAQHEEAVVVGRCGIGVRGREDGHQLPAARRDRDERRRLEARAGSRRLGLELDPPGAGSAARVRDREEEPSLRAAPRHVEVPERERRRLREQRRIRGGGDVGEAASLEEHGRLPGLLGVPPGRGGGGDEGGLHLPRGPAGVQLEQQRRGPGDVRRGHARAVEDRERRAGELAQRGGEDRAARRGEVGLQLVAESGRAARREAT